MPSIALDNGIPITKPSYFKNVSTDELAAIFKSDTLEEIPMLTERVQLIKQAGHILCDLFQGSFLYCVQKANHSAQSLIDIILDHFPSFRDIHQFKGQTGNKNKKKKVKFKFIEVLELFHFLFLY